MYFLKPTFIQKIVFNRCIWNGYSQDKTIYLTFDDGPTEEVTEYVLKTLSNFDAKATFFVLGKQVEKNPHLLKSIQAENHSIGNHTYDHTNGWTVSAVEYVEKVKKCDDVLNQAGVQTQLFRPPYGRMTLRQAQMLYDQKKVVMWSFLSGDFDSNRKVKSTLNTLKKAKSGDIIVFHDSEKAFPQLKLLLPQIMEYYSEQGFQFKAL